MNQFLCKTNGIVTMDTKPCLISRCHGYYKLPKDMKTKIYYTLRGKYYLNSLDVKNTSMPK